MFLTSHIVHPVGSPIPACHRPKAPLPVPVCVIVGLLAPTHSTLRFPSHIYVYMPACPVPICPPAQCPVPSPGGLYLYAYFKPRPIPRPSHSTLLHVLSGRQTSASEAQACSAAATVLGLGHSPGTGTVRLKNANFLNPTQTSTKFLAPKNIPGALYSYSENLETIAAPCPAL